MLDKLHKQIQQIIDINGISEISQGSYIIDYKTDPTEEQYSQINSILQNWPLTCAKLEKYKQLDDEWQIDINNGFLTSYGWKLGLSTNDISLLTGAFILAKEANQLNITSPILIVDTDGYSHELTFQEFTTLMLSYGNARSLLSQEYANKKLAINNANSLEELQNL